MQTFTQISTIDALMAGCYDGVMPVKTLHQYGNFGIGAYERVDGELVMLNDTLFQILADGRAKTTQLPDSTPYAAVIRFKPDRSAALNGPMTLDSLKARLAAAFPNKNLFYAVRVEGIFKSVTTRSVPPQSKPYAPLADVLAAQQIIIKTENITGTVVGLYCPAFMKNLNVPGFHLHFVSGDRKTGGHLFDGVLSSGQFDVQACAQFRMILPESGEGFGSADLSRDRSDEMEKVIREPK